MKVKYLAFWQIKYKTLFETEEEIVKKIEDTLNINFSDTDQPHGIPEKVILAYCIGLKIRLEIWHGKKNKNELFFQLTGSNTINEYCDPEDIFRIDEYIQELLRVRNFLGWYTPKEDEWRKEGEEFGLM